MKFKLTIGNKIQICVIVMILLTVCLVIGTTFPKFEKTIADSTKNQLMDQVTSEAESITNIVTEYSESLKSLAKNESVISDISAGKANSCKETLSEFCHSESDIGSVTLLDSQGNVITGTDSSYTQENIDLSLFSTEKEYSVSGVINAGSGKESVIITVPVKQSDNTILGAVTANIRYEIFDEAMKKCSVTGIDNLAAYIMDKDGIIFGHTEENKVGTAVKNSVIQNVVKRLKQGEKIEKEGTSYEYNGEEKFAGYYIIPDSQWIVCMSVSESEIINPVKKAEYKAYLLSIVLCVFACIVTILLTSIIVKPINVTNKVLNQIAGFHFKLDKDYSNYAKRRDETGEMCSSICTVVESLREEMTQINSVSEELTSSSDSLQKIASSVAQSSENNSKLTYEMTASFDNIDQASSDIRQYINNVQESANEMNSKAIDSMEKAQSLMNRAAQIKNKASLADRESEKMFSKVKETMETAMQQAESVEKIGMFTDSIMSISDETKLLALNATIEAANAGEHGKGFAVVAKEIGKLATQSAQSADSIGGLVNEIYQAVNGLKNCLEQSLTYIENQVIPDYRQFSEASEGYSSDAGNMIESMNFLQHQIQEFSNAMEKSVHAVEQINVSIADSAQMMHSMSGENESVGSQIVEIYDMIQENSQLSDDLKKIVEKYSL